MKKFIAILLILMLSISVFSTVLIAPASAKVDTKTLILATTTSTKDTGLLDYLLPLFTKKTGITVKPIAVGTGEALKMGQRGDADVLLVHAPKSEADFMKAGYGSIRKPVMYNYFVIIGPKNDPAGVGKSKNAADAFKRIANKKAKFVSRGDDSGTNKKELELWKAAKVTTSGSWYMKTGQGMAATIRIANEKNAYTLADEGTYLVQKKNIKLKMLRKKTKDLKNFYSVIVVNPAKQKSVNYYGAKQFANWMVSSSVQKLIGKYGSKKYGKPLFIPDAKTRK